MDDLGQVESISICPVFGHGRAFSPFSLFSGFWAFSDPKPKNLVVAVGLWALWKVRAVRAGSSLSAERSGAAFQGAVGRRAVEAAHAPVRFA